MKTKECLICSNQFLATPPNKLWCSPECKYEASQERSKKQYLIWRDDQNIHNIEKTCEVCSKIFSTNREASRFCNRKCAGIGKNKRQRFTERKSITCETCGVLVNDIRVTQKTRFCSRQCAKFSPTFHDIEKTCEACGNQFTASKYHQDKRFCTRTCATKGERNPQFGKPSHWRGKKPWNYGKTANDDPRIAETARKVGLIISKKFKSGEMSHAGKKNAMYGRNHTVSARESMSKTKCEKIINGEYASWFKRGIYFSSKLQRELTYRSSWELSIFKYLDKDKSVKSYDVEPIYIPYEFNGMQKHYIPDIIIDYDVGTRKLIEIKPRAFIEYDITLAKAAAARALCADESMLFETWMLDRIHKKQLDELYELKQCDIDVVC